jgi:hypothetical protein
MNPNLFYGQRQGSMTMDQIRHLAPSVFAEAAHDSRSARYAYIPTSTVIESLMAEGFEVFGAKQTVCRDIAKRDHTKHLLRLRHGTTRNVGDSAAEIILMNSHDGSSSYQMMGGMFRLVCSNGMVAPDGVCETVKVLHKGNVLDDVREGAFTVLDGLTRVIESRDEMRALTLSDGEQTAFAAAALTLRFEPNERTGAMPVTPEQVIRPRRQADVGADIWTVFNRTQENLVRGGLRGRDANGSRRQTRAVTGIDQDVKLNRALWTLAEAMRGLKAN